MKIRLLSALICLLACNWILAQNKKELLEWETTLNDATKPRAERMQAGVDLGEKLFLSDPAKADSIWNVAIRLDKNEKEIKQLSTLLVNTGVMLTRGGEPDSAIKHFRKALEYRSVLGDVEGQASCLNMMGKMPE